MFPAARAARTCLSCHQVTGRSPGESGALAGIDIALWDILGKVTDQPVATLLGAAGIEKVAAYVGCMSMGHKPLPDLQAEARSYADAGYQATKSVAAPVSRADIEAMTPVREAVGPDADLRSTSMLASAGPRPGPRCRTHAAAAARQWGVLPPVPYEHEESEDVRACPHAAAMCWASGRCRRWMIPRCPGAPPAPG